MLQYNKARHIVHKESKDDQFVMDNLWNSFYLMILAGLTHIAKPNYRWMRDGGRDHLDIDVLLR